MYISVQEAVELLNAAFQVGESTIKVSRGQTGQSVTCRVPDRFKLDQLVAHCGNLAAIIRRRAEAPVKLEKGGIQVRGHLMNAYRHSESMYRWDIYNARDEQEYYVPNYHIALFLSPNGIREVSINLWV